MQSLLVSILKGADVLETTEDQKNLQNFLICVEMLPAAIGMLFAFPYHEYKAEGTNFALTELLAQHLNEEKTMTAQLPICLLPGRRSMTDSIQSIPNR